MCLITLVATGHREHGLCNLNELYKIIEGIAPEVIFEEVPPNKFYAVYEGKLSDSLETSTIKRYLQKYPITHFPVDMDIDDLTNKHIRREVGVVLDLVEYHCPEYGDLINEHENNVERFGFPYLNSDRCSSLLERKRFLEEQILSSFKDNTLSETYSNWLNFLDSREDKMIKNINDYSKHNKYARALFLVGAEHKKPIMNKISKLESSIKEFFKS